MNLIEVISSYESLELNETISEARTPSLSVAIIDPFDADVLVTIGARCCSGVPLVIVSDDAKSIPDLLKNYPHVFSSDKDFIEMLLNTVRKVLGIPKPSHLDLSSLEHIVKWLSNDLERLYQLDSKTFEKFIALYLENNGFSTDLISHHGNADLWVKLPNSDLNWIVECITARKGQSIGLNTVRKVNELCNERRSKFSLLVTNSYFTRAAEDWASRCVPAVHIVDNDALKMIIEHTVYPKQKDSETGRELLFNIIRKRALEQKSVEISEHDSFSRSAKKYFELWTESMTKRKLAKLPIRPLKYCFIIDELDNLPFDYKFSEYTEQLNKINIEYKIIEKDVEPDISKWPATIKESDIIVLLFNLYDETKYHEQKRLLQLVAYCYEPFEAKKQFYICGHDNLTNRLSLPKCLRNVHFYDFDTISPKDFVKLSIKHHLSSLSAQEGKTNKSIQLKTKGKKGKGVEF